MDRIDFAQTVPFRRNAMQGSLVNLQIWVLMRPDAGTDSGENAVGSPVC